MSGDHAEMLRLLAVSQFAAGLTDSQLQALIAVARQVTLPQGHVLFQEGTTEDEIFVVTSGQIGLYMRAPRRGNIKLLTAGPGDLVGWSGLIGDGRMTASAVADSDSVLIALSGARVRQLCTADHELGWVLMQRLSQVLSRRLLATRLQLLDLFLESEPSAGRPAAAVHSAESGTGGTAPGRPAGSR